MNRGDTEGACVLGDKHILPFMEFSQHISGVWKNLKVVGDTITELDLFPEAVMKPSLQAAVAKRMTTFHKTTS